MALIFPTSPTLNQTYSSGSSSTYQWNGTFWQTITPPTQVIVTALSASFATTATSASFATTRTRPQFISVVKIDDQSTVATATDITFGTVEASNGLTLTSNSVALTGGKVYQITAAFSVNTFSNTSSGYSIVSLYNSSNTKLSQVSSALVTPAATNELNSPILNLVYAPSTNTTVKFRVADASGTVLYRGGGFTNFTITEIL